MDEKENSVYTVIVISSIIIGLILTYFFYSILRQQRKNVELQRKLILAEITGLEKDRARIASDLHDEISPVLSGIRIKINSFDLISREDQVELDGINKHIDNTFSRMREISYDLVPTVLFSQGLVAAFKGFVDFINDRKGLKIDLNVKAEVMLNEQKAVNLYRIFQETVHNTVKHANASRLTINITRDKSNIIINLKDNGVGFDYSGTLSAGRGLGLKSIFNRTRLLDGEMYVDSKKDYGTEYTFIIPY